MSVPDLPKPVVADDHGSFGGGVPGRLSMIKFGVLLSGPYSCQWVVPLELDPAT
jgi:hypothetical protein